MSLVKLDTTVEQLGLPKRAVNALRAGGIASLHDVAEWPERELRALPNCGDATIAALREILDRAGYGQTRRSKAV
jgi:DNA-directed RNA polymerase alpha subunit